MKNGRTRVVSWVVGGLAIALAFSTANAQPTAHYVPGVEGIEGLSLPPPGVYLRDYNVFYDADQLDDASGHKVKGLDFHTFVYAQVCRPVWITDLKVLGGNFGVDALWPVVDTDVTAGMTGLPGKFDQANFGFGDPFVGTTISWHYKPADFSIGVGEWFPGGAYSPGLTAKPGLGYYGTMFTAGVTFYPDEAKTWSISALSRYEINGEQRETGITPGDAYTLEWAVAKRVVKDWNVGVVGYYQQQATLDRGTNANKLRDAVFAAGPEIATQFPSLHLFATLRYRRELWASNRAEGNTCVLTLTYRF